MLDVLKDFICDIIKVKNAFLSIIFTWSFHTRCQMEYFEYLNWRNLKVQIFSNPVTRYQWRHSHNKVYKPYYTKNCWSNCSCVNATITERQTHMHKPSNEHICQNVQFGQVLMIYIRTMYIYIYIYTYIYIYRIISTVWHQDESLLCATYSLILKLQLFGQCLVSNQEMSNGK